MKNFDKKSLLQETYYGKDDTLLECERCISAMKEAIMSGKNPNKITEKTQFESLICKKFNCEKVYLSIIADESGLNAYTMPFFYEKNRNYDDKFFDLVSDRNGMRYKNPIGKTLYIYVNTYTIRNFSVDSCMGILLHEIGHNFFFIKEQVQNRKSKMFTEFVLYLLKLLDQYNYDPKLTVEVVKALIDVGLQYKQGIQATVYEETKKLLTDKAYDIVNNKYKSKHTGIGKAFYTLTRVAGGILSAGFNLTSSIITTLFLPLLINSASYKKLGTVSKKQQGYNAEKFCDNFAASFGYAAGVADTFNKDENFTYGKQVTSKIPLVRILNYYSDVLSYFVFYMDDEHPTHQKRVTFALEKLKYELANNRENMSPQQIKEIEDDIESIEKLIKKTPYFKKAINSMFSRINDKRDTAGSVGISDEEIYDFDKTILKDKVKKEDLGIAAYMTENYDEAIKKYFSEPIMEILSE